MLSIFHRKKSIAAGISLGITAILVFNASLSLILSLRAPKRNALEIAESIRSTAYFIWGCLM